MGISKTVKINDTTVTVRELTVREIYDLANGSGDNAAAAIAELLETCSTVKTEFVMELAPSELQPLIEAMIEVNRPFLDQAAAIGMDEAAAGMEKMVRSIFSLPFLASSA